MKAQDLKMHDVVRYKGNTGPYMDMTVCEEGAGILVAYRPYILEGEAGILVAYRPYILEGEARIEKCVFHRTSNMEFELKYRPKEG